MLNAERHKSEEKNPQVVKHYYILFVRSSKMKHHLIQQFEQFYRNFLMLLRFVTVCSKKTKNKTLSLLSLEVATVAIAAA